MKNLKFAIVVAAIVGLMAAGLTTYAETIRQGGDRATFNQSSTTTKTADYTVLTTDSLLKVSAASVDVVITLPDIDTVRASYPGGKSYKILKSDDTPYDIVVTPATGDTIGGESTRYITKQNDYIIIQTGSGDNWQVIFESELINSDHEAGTVTLPSVINLRSSTVYEGATADAYETTVTVTDPTADRTITIPDDNGTVVLTSATQSITGAKTFGVSTTFTITNGVPNRLYLPNVNGVTKKLKITALGNVSGIAP